MPELSFVGDAESLNEYLESVHQGELEELAKDDYYDR